VSVPLDFLGVLQRRLRVDEETHLVDGRSSVTCSASARLEIVSSCWGSAAMERRLKENSRGQEFFYFLIFLI
jgi:hypothetical protein